MQEAEDPRVAVVTGGGTGVGAAVARALASNGWSTIICGRRLEILEEVAAGFDEQGLTARVDVSDPADVDRLFSLAAKTFGRVDLLFNNAGISISGTVLDVDELSYDKLFAVKVKGVFLGCKEAIPIMASHGGGVIINIASA